MNAYDKVNKCNFTTRNDAAREDNKNNEKDRNDKTTATKIDILPREASSEQIHTLIIFDWPILCLGENTIGA